MFSTAGNWITSDSEFQTVPFTDDTATIPPRPGDAVNFRDGTYSVNMAGASTAIDVTFENGSTPNETWNVTLSFAGNFQTTQMFGPATNVVTFTGSGIVTASSLFPGGSGLVVDGLEFHAGDIPQRTPLLPVNPPQEMLVRNNGKLVTQGTVNLYGITVQGGEWDHTGPADGLGNSTISAQTPQVTLDGGRWASPGITIRTTHITTARNGSVANIGAYVDDMVAIESGSVMNNQSALAGLNSTGVMMTRVDGAGSQWNVTGHFQVQPAGGVLVTNGGALSAQSMGFDANSFGDLTVVGVGSVASITNLVVGPATVTVSSQGTVNSQSVQVGDSNTGTGGINLLSAGQLEVGGTLSLGGVNGSQGQVSVGGGADVFANEVVIGQSTQANLLTVDGAGGASAVHITSDLLVGQAGRGNVQILNGGVIQLTGQYPFVSVTPYDDGLVANGSFLVSGVDSLLDVSAGALGVGIGGDANLTVIGGGKVKAGTLDVGAVSFGAGSQVMVTGNTSAILTTGGIRLWQGRIQVLNGGFVGLQTDVSTKSLTIIEPAVITINGGGVKVGSAGAPPAGVLRVDNGFFNGSGTITGAVEVIAQGIISPGSHESPRIAISGTYLQSGGTLEVEVTGSALANNDHLEVGGSATITGGQLVVYFAGETAPKTGDTFPFLKFGNTLTGTFPTVTIVGLEPGFQFTQEVIAPGLFGIVAHNDGALLGTTNSTLSATNNLAGQYGFTISGQAGRRYEIQSSSDLKTWSFLSSLVLTNGTGTPYVDQSSALYRQRFYRLLQQ